MSNEQLLQSTTANRDEITWSGDGKFIEALSVKPVENNSELVEITVRTQFLTAKNPDEWRVKAQIFLLRRELKELHEVIGRVLGDVSGSSGEALDE
jgi:hypothetical protein